MPPRLTTGYHARVRAVSHPVLRSPTAFVAEVYFYREPEPVGLFGWLMKAFGLWTGQPERLYSQRFDLPAMPQEIECAYLWLHTDGVLGVRTPRKRWWFDAPDADPQAVLWWDDLGMTKDQLQRNIDVWLKITQRVQAKAETEAQRAAAELAEKHCSDEISVLPGASVVR